MKLDRYTKAVLTIISACLFYLCLTASRAPVHADEPVRVVLVDGSNHPIAAGTTVVRGSPLRVEMDQ